MNVVAELSDRERAVWRALRPGRKTPIETIYKAVYGADKTTPRKQQQRLGAIVTRINGKLKSAKSKQRVKIVKGLRRTYTLA
jgi:hypothetical protein